MMLVYTGQMVVEFNDFILPQTHENKIVKNTVWLPLH